MNLTQEQRVMMIGQRVGQTTITGWADSCMRVVVGPGILTSDQIEELRLNYLRDPKGCSLIHPGKVITPEDSENLFSMLLALDN